MSEHRPFPDGCPSDDDLSAYVEGLLTRADSEAIRAHLRDCDRCHVVMIAFGLARGSDDGTQEMIGSDWGGANGFGRFETLELLGEGGMGVVYRARDRASGREVALKLLKTTHPENEVDADLRLRREARVLSALAHPNVVRIEDAGVYRGRPYIAMELVDGRTLSVWRLESPRTCRDVVKVFIDVARGLAAVHAMGLVHRDLKPANILIDRGGCARITDFGLARRIRGGGRDDDASSTVTRPGFVPGTAPYMSPEQFRGSLLDGRSDQFSFFVCLHEALTGQRPFLGSSFEEVGKSIVLGNRVRPTSLSDLSPTLLGAIDRGLSPRDQRFRDMIEVELVLRSA
jgi:serine/threonine protein kinase